ncbi:MAG: ribosome maturation factor RimP [Bacillota bacterium]
MGQKDALNKLFETFEPLLKDMGYELLDVELTSEMGRPILRVTICKPEGITLDDCVAVDKALDPVLEELDPIPGSYNLEVSSPGLERTLKRNKEYEVFSGRACRVNLYAPVDGKRTFEGTLVGLGQIGDEQAVVIRGEHGELALPRRNVSKVQLVYKERPL